MTEQKNGNGNGIIKMMRHVFNIGIISSDCRQLGRHRGVLPEGYGVVVVNQGDGSLVAYGDATSDQEILEAHLSGARVAYGNQAVLIKMKENGNLICQRRRQVKPELKTKKPWQ